VIEIP